MVLEAIISPKRAREQPWLISILAFIFVSVGILAADYLGISKSIMTLTFVAVPSIPFIWQLFDYEQRETERQVVLGSRTIARHLPVIIVLAFFFVGLVAGFVYWFFALPPGQSAEVFEVQLTELRAIGATSGKFVFEITNEAFLHTFEMLFFHNFGVLLIILALSLLYGAGAVFVLIWNAAIIGVFIGNYAKIISGGNSLVPLLGGIGTSALGLLPHGSFELLAYLVAALAGGILSSAITREAHKTSAFPLIIHDTVKLTAVSVILLGIGAFIEAGAIVG